MDVLREGMSQELRRLLLGRTKGLSFNELVKICQETDTESHTIHLSEGRSYQHPPNAQGHNHSRVATAAPLAINPVPSGSGNRH